MPIVKHRPPVPAYAMVAAAALALAACELPETQAPRAEEQPSAIAAPLQASNAAAAGLYRVVETWFNDYLALHPVFATELGDHRFDDRFGDYASVNWMADSLGIEQEALERLATVDRAQLEGEDLVSYEAFRRERELAAYGFRYPSELLALDATDHWGNVFARMASGRGAHPFDSSADYDRFLARMDGFAAWADQTVNNLRAGVSKGVVLPKVVVAPVLPQLEVFARIEDPRQSPLWRPLLNFPAAMTVADRRRLLAAYDAKLRTTVIPAYRRLHDFLATEYLPRARDTIAWSDLPGGAAWYAHLVRSHTTLDSSPGEVHELGLREVARVRAELANLQPALGVGGDVQALLDGMRVDRRFHAPDVATLLAGYGAVRTRVGPALASLFDRAPRTRFVIRPVETYRAAAAPLVGYRAPSADGRRPGVVEVNALAPAAHPTYLVESLYLHAAVPGLHFATARAQSTPNLPSFRRFGRVAAFDRGWAHYAETLGPRLGVQLEPHAQFGALSVQLWRAALLVIDTGVHARGWTRAQAIDYLRANSALAADVVAAEVDRCIARPGETLAYTVGQLELAALRQRAERRLGARFDLREFHAQVLGGGSLPLPVLAARMDRWLARVSAPSVR